MDTRTGRYRVLDGLDDRLLLVDRSDYETVAVDASAGVAVNLRPGQLVDAAVAFPTDDPARVVDVDVVRDSRYAFVDGATPMFEAAQECWRAARAAGEGMNSQVTRNTDAEVNGVLYVFADSSGGQSVFEEFRSGARPLEPLVDRVNESEGDAPREVFVLRPPDEYVAVYIALERDGRLSRTVRETYGLPLDRA